MKLSCGILAGGKSIRMGYDKALLPVGQKTFLQIVADELMQYEELFVSVDQLHKYKELPYALVEDSVHGIGPIEGIRQILLHAHHEHVFICATDMPFLKKKLVDYLIEFISSDYDCFVATGKGRIQPLCAVYSKAILPDIEASIEAGQYQLVKLLNRVRTKYISLELSCFPEKWISNINTKEEFQALRRPSVFCVSGLKNSGKTSLIERLIDEFKPDYQRIGVIKHDGHEFSMDQKGTDTDRFIRAGAEQTAIFSNTQYAVIHKLEGVQLSELIQNMDPMDLIIIEGMKSSSYPKVEVVREGVSDQCICNQDTLIAVASDTIVKNKRPEIVQIDLNDTKAIAELVKTYFNTI